MRALLGDALLIAGLACLSPTAGGVELPHLFADHMVLQRDMLVPIWGHAAAGEIVSVTFGTHHARAVAGEDGAWRVFLGPLDVGPPAELRVCGEEKKEEIVLADVVVGEVWLCSGQSNMAFPLQRAKDGEGEVSRAHNSRLRLFLVGRAARPTAQGDVAGSWQPCTPESASNFSAVAYFFGREIAAYQEVPIGLIQSAWGGTRAEAWTSVEALTAAPELAPLLDHQREAVTSWPARQAAYQSALARWKVAAAKARQSGEKPPRKPTPPADPATWRHSLGALCNGMIAPLIPFAMRGVIWYQGESNASRAYQYRVLFPTMIRDWRRRWGRGSFPFLFVQLANYGRTRPKGSWPELREAQAMALALPATGMAVSIDIGNPQDIHPKDKQEVGRRLSLWARARVYGEKIPYCGPILRSSTFRGKNAILGFEHVEGGLAARGGDPLGGFELAGTDRVFHPAQAKILGENIVVSSAEVDIPLAVRYGWHDAPTCNLVNGAGLPAAPFRTDDWPGVTIDNR